MNDDRRDSDADDRDTGEFSDRRVRGNDRRADGASFRPRKFGSRSTIILICCIVAVIVGVYFLVLNQTYRARENAARELSANNLKMMEIALENHESAYGQLPGAAICDKDGNPLLSWRVAILPFIEQQGLYMQFHLDEPWDSPHNIKLIQYMPRLFASRTQPDDNEFKTFYRVFHGKGAAFEGTKGLSLEEFADKRSETILIVEAGESVIWTKPEELEFDSDKPLPRLGGMFPKRDDFQVIMADGTVRKVKRNVSESTLRAAITRSGNDPLGPDW